MNTNFRDKISALPDKSGCYLFKDSENHIIYIGKAKSLKKRVNSYFVGSQTLKTHHLVSKISDLDFFITENEVEALILENNLIKKHKPKFNIRLRDDKSYPYIAINRNQNFPRLLFLRRITQDKKKNLKLFGPFPHGANLGSVMRTLNKLFKLRDCSDFELNSRKTPCLLYQMNQCSAPCVELIDKNSYKKQLEKALHFLKGEKEAKKILDELKLEMMNFASRENFEYAAVLRDGIYSLEKFVKGTYEQSVELLTFSKDLDIISYFEGENEIDLSLYMMRNGKIWGQKAFHFKKNPFFESIESQISSLLFDLYTEKPQELPASLVIDIQKEERDLLKDSLEKEMGRNVKMISPENLNYRPLVRSVKDHAKESQKLRLDIQESELRALEQLSQLLGLKRAVSTIECYDIAIWQGSSPTASLIYFKDGKPLKTKYRYYHLETRDEGNNDFAMMREVFERRLKREDFPDIFLVDGGKGQVSVVKEVLKDFKIDIPVVGIAKAKVISDIKKYQKDVKHSEERLVIPGQKNTIDLRKYYELYRLLTSMRDEAHRFSRKLHHKTEKKRLFSSWVDDLKGFSDEERNNILTLFPKANLFKKEKALFLSETKIKRIMEYIKKEEEF